MFHSDVGSNAFGKLRNFVELNNKSTKEWLLNLDNVISKRNLSSFFSLMENEDILWCPLISLRFNFHFFVSFDREDKLKDPKIYFVVVVFLHLQKGSKKFSRVWNVLYGIRKFRGQNFFWNVTELLQIFFQKNQFKTILR